MKSDRAASFGGVDKKKADKHKKKAKRFQEETSGQNVMKQLQSKR